MAAKTALNPLDHITIHLTQHPVKTFLPAHAFGAGIDGAESGSADKLFHPAPIAAMRSMGLRSLTYRLRTELAIESWHWNPRGRWSDARRRSGYWTSDSNAVSGPISVGWGYRLPRRGSTIDQANDDGYSRIDDGDSRTFWKSNPYLDSHFTHEPNTEHPQWVVVDLGETRPINAIRIQWGTPFATHYNVAYGILPSDIPVFGSESAFEPAITWHTFPNGVFDKAKGGDVRQTFAATPINARFVRIWMDASSGDGASGEGRDIRDRLGYAIRELSVGQVNANGRLKDWIRHGCGRREQSVVYTSSTDPWHTSRDCDSGIEQPGFDRVVGSGLTNGLPMLAPISLLYDTPENAVAELQYLRARHIDVRQVEMGEEPDGQYVTPEDYGALYVQWADALHRVDPTLKLGGPSFQTAVQGWVHWENDDGDSSWMRRFLAYLTAHKHRSDFTFFSFEWYPFDDLDKPASAQVSTNAGLLQHAMTHLIDDGVPRDIPWIISEYGYSSFATRDEVTMPAALINAETVAEFLTLGGDQANLYGYPPGDIHLDHGMPGATWGDLIALLADDDGNVDAKLPAYWAAWILTHIWTVNAARPHDLYTATVAGSNGKSDPLLAAFPVRRSDGHWAVLLLNKDAQHSRQVQLTFDGAGQAPSIGDLTVWKYSSDQFVWKDAGHAGHPLRNLPPARSVVHGGNQDNPAIEIPAFSVCVVVL